MAGRHGAPAEGPRGGAAAEAPGGAGAEGAASTPQMPRRGLERQRSGEAAALPRGQADGQDPGGRRRWSLLDNAIESRANRDEWTFGVYCVRVREAQAGGPGDCELPAPRG
ncbi:unnamed protein product, partial [Prorocentrum cordatum]